MNKGEVSTSTIVWISVALIVLVLILAGVVTKINQGNKDLRLQQCRLKENADPNFDDLMDAVDPCPCGDSVNENKAGGKGCFDCKAYDECDPEKK